MAGISDVGRKRSKVVLPRYIDNSDFWLHPDIYNTLNNLQFVLLSYLDHYPLPCKNNYINICSLSDLRRILLHSTSIYFRLF